MPGTVKVKVLSARNLPVMDRATFLTDAFVELCIGSITYKTEVVRRSLNPSWNSDWFCFKLDDQALQEEALLLKVMDHDTYSAHDTIGRVYFDLNPLLSRGQTRCLNGWFPIYDTMHGIRGEICLAIRVDVFLDASRYHQSSLEVRFFHCCTIPQGFVIDSLIGFIQELVMNYDPEHQWIEKIRTSRASNEARQRLFSRLSGELQRKMGLKVLNLGGNSLIGYQLHFDLEGETGVVVRGIGTAVRLKKYNPVTTPPNSPTGTPKNTSLHRESPTVHKECIPESAHSFPLHAPQSLDLGEFPFLTISQPLPGMISHFGSVVASKSVRLLDKNSPAGIQFRDAWWLELRSEIVTHMRSIGCDAVLAYREECAIYEDVCVLSSYGTGVQLNPKWSPTSLDPTRVTGSLGLTSVTLQTASEKILGSVTTPKNFFYDNDAISVDNPCVYNCSSGMTTSNPSVHVPLSEITPVPSPSSYTNKEPNRQSSPQSFVANQQKTRNHYQRTKPDCHICHLPSTFETNSTRTAFPITSSRCAVCKAANVPDLLFSSSDFPPELSVIGNPALIQARVCRLKKDTKGEVAASELSEILPFIDYELHYRLMQKLRLRSMNGLFGLRYRLAIGEYMIAAIATGTGVYVGALPPPPPPRIIPSLHSSMVAEDRCAYERLKNQVDDYLRKNRQLYRISDMIDCQDNLTKFSELEFSDFIPTNYYNTTGDISTGVKSVESQLKNLHINTLDNSGDFDQFKQSTHVSDFMKSSTDTVFLETREPEPEELAVLLQDPIQPSGLILTTTESIPISDNLTTADGVVINNSKIFIHPSMLIVVDSKGDTSSSQLNSFIRLHEAELSVPDSFFEMSAYSVAAAAAVSSSPNNGSHMSTKSTTNNFSTLTVTSIPVTGFSTSGSLAKSQNHGLINSNSGPILNCAYPTHRNSIATATGITSGQLSSSPSSSSLITHSSSLKSKQQQDLYTHHSTGGNSLGKVLREFNQLTWFRFRHHMPCILSALDYRLSFTDDEHLQIIATGMILHPNKLPSVNCEKSSMSMSNSPSSNNSNNHLKQHPDTLSKKGGLIKTHPRFYLHKAKDCKILPEPSTHRTDLKAPISDDITNDEKAVQQENHQRTDKHIPGCILTPLSSLPNMCVETYHGNLDFFFIRETTDLREVGGISGFLHTSLCEVQAVVGAHTASLGGNALLSYHLSEIVVLRPTSRNQAQCLLNVCGDMAKVSWETTAMTLTRCKHN
ncbi:unnamed protein product [Heterobilharzia americana]|nr:unnamed protein product [Heterobilharzia americana]